MDNKSQFITKYLKNLFIFGIGIGAVMLLITAIDYVTGVAGLGILLCLSSLVLWMLWGTTESQIKFRKWEKKD